MSHYKNVEREMPTPDVLAVGKLKFTGNIIPHTWKDHIRKPNARAEGGYVVDAIAMCVLAEIVFWYRPTEIKDEESNGEVYWKKKFWGDKLQLSYDKLSDSLGFSKNQIRDALIVLEDIGVVNREFRTVVINGTKLHNVLYLNLNVVQLEKMSYPSFPIVEDPSLPIAQYPPCNCTTPTLQLADTYTENTLKSPEIKHSNETSFLCENCALRIEQTGCENDLVVRKTEETIETPAEHLNKLATNAAAGKAMLDELFPREPKTLEEPVAAVNWADRKARESAIIDATLKHAEACANNEWSTWNTDKVKTRDGISADALRHVGWLIENVTGVVPNSKQLWDMWRKAYVELYNECNGDFALLKEAVEKKWIVDNPRFRSVRPAAILEAIAELRADKEKAKQAPAISKSSALYNFHHIPDVPYPGL